MFSKEVLTILAVFLANSSSEPSTSADNPLEAVFPLFGISKIAANSDTGRSVCSQQLKSIYYGIRKRETWALRMLDSSGAPRNGFIWGNNYWLGTYSQCQWVSSEGSVPPPKSGSSEFQPFPVDFFVGSFTHNSKLQAKVNAPQENLIVIGLCLPSACSVEDLRPVLSSWSSQDHLTVQLVYNFTVKFENVRVIKKESLLNSPLAVILSFFVGIIAVTVLAGTVYDVCVWAPKERKAHEVVRLNGNDDSWDAGRLRNIRESDEVLNRDINLNYGCEYKIDNFSHKSIPARVSPEGGSPARKANFRNAPERLLICFSVASNARTMAETNYNADNVPAIHGLRFLGMIWILCLYTVYYLRDFADNKPLLLRISRGFSEQVISNSTFSVDTFFFASGFLLSYIYFRNRRGSATSDSCGVKRSVNMFCSMLLRRVIRLTPVYLFVLAIAHISIKYNNRTSLFEVTELSEDVCEKYWWRNLLFINNLFRPDEMCMSWSWYISTEMQFFMLGAFLLIVSDRHWKFSVILVASLVAISSITNGYLSYTYSFAPTLDQQLAGLHALHYPPWTRVVPYLLGMSSGYIVIHLKRKLNINRATLITCWITGCACNLWAIFGLYKKDISVISTSLYSALSRPAWGFGLSWIVISCTTDNAGVLKDVLSFRSWIPLSKLSFTTYLLGPLIINLIYSSSETPIHLDFFPMIIYFIGFTGVTYLCSLVLCLALELPFNELGKRLVGRKHVINQLN